jgi:hypothetical protein
MIKVLNIISKKNVISTFMGSLFVSLVVYRTFKPINFNNNKLITVDKIKKFNISENYIILENNNILLTININGGFINNIFFKKYNKIFLQSDNKQKDEVYDSYNCFQTGWFSDDNNTVPHRIKTKWEILKSDKNSLVLVTKIKGIEFKKTFILENDKLIMEDSFNNINNSIDVVLYNYGGFSVIPDTKEKEDYNFLTYTDQNNLITIHNQQIKKIKKENVAKSNNSWFGLSDEYFLLFAKTNDGEVYSDVDLYKNKFYYSSDDIYTPNKKYVMYILPKDKLILNNYNINGLLTYGFSGPMKYILFPFKIFVYFLHEIFIYINKLFKKPILALFLITLIILLLNFLCIFFIEKEQVKFKIHKDEKNFIENNYKEDQQKHLMYFYQKHNIKIMRITYLNILIAISWAILNKTMGLCFSLKGHKFLYIQDLMMQDPYSILNLYGLLKFKIPLLITKNISTDILSLTAIYLYTNNNKNNNLLNSSSNNNSSFNNVSFDNNNVFKIIQLFLLGSLSKSLSSGFLICLIFILLASNLFKFFIQKYFNKTNNLIE